MSSEEPVARKMTSLKIIVSILGLMLIVALYIYGSTHTRTERTAPSTTEAEIVQKAGGPAKKTSPSKGTVIPVRVINARYESAYETEERYAGRILSRRSSKLGFERSGRLAKIMVDEGDNVTKGDILASLAIRALQAQRRALAAQLVHSHAQHREAIARLAFAKATIKRRSKLAKGNNISHQLYDEAVFDQAAADAQLAASNARIAEMKASLSEVDVKISESSIRAPFDGHVVARLMDEGAIVSTGSAIVKIVEAKALEARVGVPPSLAHMLRAGEIHQIEFGGQTIEVPIRSILEEIDTKTRSVPVIFDISENPHARIGQIARLIVKRKIDAKGFWIPISSLVEGRRGLWNAFALEKSGDEDGTFRISQRELQLIHHDGTRVYVTGTVSDGEQLISTGLHRLVPGQTVRLTE